MKGRDVIVDVITQASRAVRAFLEGPDFQRMLQDAAQSGGGMEQRLAEVLEQQIRTSAAPVRQHWARSDAYIAARDPDQEEARSRAVAEASRSGRVVEAATRHGISRATMYRLMKK